MKKSIETIGFCYVNKICSNCGYETGGNSYKMENCPKCGQHLVEKSTHETCKEIFKEIDAYLKMQNEIINESEDIQICLNCGYKTNADKYAYINCPICNSLMIEENDGNKTKNIHKIKEETKKYGLN